MRDQYFVYILTNDRHTVLYTGVTNNLVRRIGEHRVGFSCFTSRYNVHKLVYFEEFHEINDAIAREKQIKGGSRRKKVLLIDSMNLTGAICLASCCSRVIVSLLAKRSNLGSSCATPPRLLRRLRLLAMTHAGRSQ